MDQERTKAHFLTIYDTHFQEVYRFCLFKVSRKELAEDLAQETFTKYWQSLREGTSIKNDRAFLFTIARNLVIDWYRKKKESSLDSMTDAGFEFESTDQEAITSHAEAVEVLSIVDRLDSDSKEVLLMRYVEGFSPREIASIRQETANSVSVRLNRAVKKVQELIHAKE